MAGTPEYKVGRSSSATGTSSGESLKGSVVCRLILEEMTDDEEPIPLAHILPTAAPCFGADRLTERRPPQHWAASALTDQAQWRICPRVPYRFGRHAAPAGLASQVGRRPPSPAAGGRAPRGLSPKPFIGKGKQARPQPQRPTARPFVPFRHHRVAIRMGGGRALVQYEQVAKGKELYVEEPDEDDDYEEEDNDNAPPYIVHGGNHRSGK